MLLSKYQRFVAWRYLLERERSLSSEILFVVGACVALCIGMGTASLLYPFSDNYMVPGPEVPASLTVLMGISVALPCIAFLAIFLNQGTAARLQHFSVPPLSGSQPDTDYESEIIHRSGGLGSIIWALIGSYWAIVSLAVFGVYAGISNVESWARYSIGQDLAFFVVAAMAVPALMLVVKSLVQETPTPPGFLGVALLLIPINFIFWFIFRHRSRGFLKVLFAIEALVLATGVSVLAYYGAKEIAWDILFPKEGTSSWGYFAVLSLGVGVLSLLAGLATPKRVLFWAASVCVFFCVASSVLATLFFCIDIVTENLEFLGGWEKYTPPMNIIIPAYVGGALGLLAFVLLVVRYYFTFFTTVSIGGVTIGTMALVIVLSVMSGFENDLRGKILGFNAHIQISKDDELQFKGYQEVQEILENTPGVVGHTPFLMTEAYMSNHNNYANVTLKGIDPARVAGVTEIVHKLAKGDERALDKIWPLSEDGSILKAPKKIPIVDFGEDTDPLIDEGPIDFSGGLDEIEDELDLGEITDFSGGLDSLEEGGEALLVDAGLGEVDAPGEKIIKQPLTPREEWETKMLPQNYIAPEIAVLDGVLVGKELVNQISLYTDQEIRVISPLPDVSPDGLSIPRIKNYRIAGKFFSGMYEYDLKYVYCSLDSLQSFLDLEDVVNGIEVRVADPTKTAKIVKSLKAQLGAGYRVQDWRELNRALFSALELEKIVMAFILVIIVLVASFSIVGNLIMVVIEKAKEIAILKTLGSSNGGVMKIFITQGFFIGLVGTGLGVGLGVGACYLGIRYGVPLDPNVYYIDKLPILVELSSVVKVGFSGIAISVLATIYPAFIAAKMRPVKGLRGD